MKIVPIATLTAVTLFGSGCHRQAEPPMTQLQIREIQTRSFACKSVKVVLKEMLNVLQDEAFIVKNANGELGFISAEKEVDIENGWHRFFSALGASGNGNQASWKKNEVIEVSANVTQFGDDTRVRVNFQKKVLDNFGRVLRVLPLYDPIYYQEFFSKVHQGLFIEQERI
jgi:hypothetical protein